MTNAQKIRLRLSQVRQWLNEIAERAILRTMKNVSLGDPYRAQLLF